MGKVISAHAVVYLEVADDGLDGGSSFEFALDLRRDAALLAARIDLELVIGWGVVAAIAGVGDAAIEDVADDDEPSWRGWPRPFLWSGHPNFLDGHPTRGIRLATIEQAGQLRELRELIRTRKQFARACRNSFSVHELLMCMSRFAARRANMDAILTKNHMANAAARGMPKINNR